MRADPNKEVPFFDVVIAGAGLGGLSAALHLLKRGFTVAVLEQADRVGGLCGTHRIQGTEYVIACNDFGAAMPRWLQQLGVDVPFKPYRTCVHYEGRRFGLPPNLSDIVRLLPHTTDLLRYLRALKAAKNTGYVGAKTLAELVEKSVKNSMIADLLKLPAYLMGVSPDQLRTDALNDEVEFGYGYFQPTVPVEGPQALADRMALKVAEAGKVMLQTRYLGCSSVGDGEKLVRTSRGILRCRYVVDAMSNHGGYPQEFKLGLPLSMYCLAVDPRFRYPEGVHTNVYYPKDISKWFKAIDEGQLPGDFGFHVFNSHLVSSTGQYTVNLYFYLPRGMEAPDTTTSGRIEAHLLDRLDSMLPGLRAAIRELHFISPKEFSARHSMSSRVLPVITPAGYPKPGNFCPKSDVYRAGAASYPPGDHAGAAVLSGRFVADLIEQARSANGSSATDIRQQMHEARSA